MDDQSIITQKWSQLIDCHWLALKNLGNPHVPACTYTHSRYAQMFEIWIRSPDCLYVVAWFQKSTTETHFKTVFWTNTSQQHTFSLSCSLLCFILLMSGWYEFLGILYFHYFLFLVPVATKKISLIRSNTVWNRWKSTLSARSIRLSLNHGKEM